MKRLLLLAMLLSAHSALAVPKCVHAATEQVTAEVFVQTAQAQTWKGTRLPPIVERAPLTVGERAPAKAAIRISGEIVEIPLEPFTYEPPPKNPEGRPTKAWIAEKLQGQIPGVKAEDLVFMGIADGVDESRAMKASMGGTRYVYAHPTDPTLLIKVYSPDLQGGDVGYVARMIRRERALKKILGKLGAKFAETVDDPALLRAGIVIQKRAPGKALQEFVGREAEFPEIRAFYERIHATHDQLVALNNRAVSDGGFSVQIFRGGTEQGFDGKLINCHFDPPPPEGTGGGITCFDM